MVQFTAVTLCNVRVGVTKEMLALHKVSALQVSSSAQCSFIVFPGLLVFGVFKRYFYKNSFIVFFSVVLKFFNISLTCYLKYVKMKVVGRTEVIGLFWWVGKVFAVNLVQPLENTEDYSAM